MTEETNVMPFDFLHPKEIGDQKHINMALLECQKRYPSIPKNGKGKVQGRSKSGSDYSYEYRYAKFDDIMDAVRPILNEHGIFISQLPFPCLVDRNLYIITTLTHAESGGKKMAYFPVCDYTDARQQEIGGNQTYAKRYSLVVLGIVLEEDIDAQYTEARTAGRNSRATRNPAPETPHDPETGEVNQPSGDETTKAEKLYNEITSDSLTLRNITDYRERVTKEITAESRKKVLRAAISAREVIMNSKTTDDLNAAREHISIVAKTRLPTKALDDFLKAREIEITATPVTQES